MFLAMAGAVLASMVLALAMAVSEELHEELHHDADHEEHECVVTHLIDGTFGDGAGLPVVDLGAVDDHPEFVRWALRETAARPLHLANGVLEHGPPVRG